MNVSTVLQMLEDDDEFCFSGSDEELGVFDSSDEELDVCKSCIYHK